jgi:hypothetical protein
MNDTKKYTSKDVEGSGRAYIKVLPGGPKENQEEPQ